MNLPSSNLFFGFFTLAAQGNFTEMDVGQDEDIPDAFVFQEVAAEAERQGVGVGGNISKLLGDLEGEVKLVVEPRVTHRTRATVVETSDSEPEERPALTKKMTREQSSKASKSSTSVAEVGMGMKKQKASSK